MWYDTFFNTTGTRLFLASRVPGSERMFSEQVTWTSSTFLVSERMFWAVVACAWRLATTAASYDGGGSTF
jgi:hypothetical protein